MTTLYEVIHDSAELTALAAAGNDTEIAAKLNEATIPVAKSISRAQVLRWSAHTQAIASLKDAENHPDKEIRAIAMAGLALLGAGEEEVYLDDEFTEFMTKLVTAQIISQDDLADLVRRATKYVSRSFVLFGRDTTPDEVSHALEPDRPGGVAGA